MPLYIMGKYGEMLKILKNTISGFFYMWYTKYSYISEFSPLSNIYIKSHKNLINLPFFPIAIFLYLL